MRHRSSPVQNGWHRNGTPASVSLLRGPNRSDWPEVVTDSASIGPIATAAEPSSLIDGIHGSATTSDAYTTSPHNTRLGNENGTHHGATVASRNDTSRIIRAARLRDLLAAVEEWRHASGPDRTYWRRDARHRLAEWRRLHVQPERAAFQAAVARSKRRAA